MSAQIRTYRTYRWIDKDPVIDKMRTKIQDEGLMQRLGVVHELSGVATATLDNWFKGETRRPQNSTIEAVMTSLGYEREFKKVKKINLEEERQKAAAWLKRQNSKPKHRTRSNGRG